MRLFTLLHRVSLLGAAALLLAVPCREAAAAQERVFYDLRYDVTLIPSERGARVTVILGNGAESVEWIRFRVDDERQFDFSGDGEIVREEGTVQWFPPKAGGRLKYFFRADHLRDERSYDARCTRKWALFRGDDLVPQARVRTSPIAWANARLRLRLPEGWSAALPYRKLAGGEYAIEHKHRRFDRPTGWIVAGKLGVVREEVAETKVAVAGPAGHGLRRLDILALLRWTLPTLHEVFGDLPERLLVVGADDPMWRGGLSGPRSVYIHADRPLMTGDGTSPLLHEVVHALMARIPGPDADWIVEGLAEVYSVEALKRSGTISEKRWASVKAELEKRGRGFRGNLLDGASSGNARARAATLLYELDAELREASDQLHSLDDVMRGLQDTREKLTTAELRATAEHLAGRELPEIFDSLTGN